MISKNLLIVTSEFPPQPGGIGNHAYNLALQLQASNYEVTVITDNRSKNGNEERQFDELAPFKVYRISRYNLLLITYIKRILVYKKLTKTNSSIIASGKFPLWLVGLDFFYANKRKFAVVHGSELNFQGVKKYLTEYSLKKIKTVIAVSNYTKSLVNHLQLASIHVIYNGFRLSNIESQQKKKKRTNTLHLITIGNVTERKGQLHVINTIPKLLKKYPKVHYHVVGIPTNQSLYEKIATELGVLNHITFYGKVTELRKYELLKKCDVFLMLSNKTSSGDVEGFGIAILEANAMGLPAIGSQNCGIEDAIQSNYSGKLVDPTDINEISAAIDEIIGDFDDFSSQAVEWSKKFNWEVVIKKYLALLK